MLVIFDIYLFIDHKIYDKLMVSVTEESLCALSAATTQTSKKSADSLYFNKAPSILYNYAFGMCVYICIF